MKKVLIGTIIVSMALQSGGKYLQPTKVPVAPIQTINTNPWYLGVGLNWSKLSDDSCGVANCSYEDATWGTILRGGYDFNQYIGIETRWIKTFWDKGPFGGTPLQHVGLYIKPQLPLNNNFNLYGLLGYGYTENLGNGGRLNYFDHDSGFSAGIGLEYDLSSKDDDYKSYMTNNNNNPKFDRDFDGHADQEAGWSIFIDYQRLLIKSNIPDLDAVSFGVRYSF
jgi:OOP family OmpA-OmpF porin